MEAQQGKSTLRSKRKPLSDCTNTLQNRRKNPSSSSSSKIPKLQTLNKPPKPFNSDANTTVNVKQLNRNTNPIPNLSTCSSPKSHTSTGSSNSPEPPAPPTPLSDADYNKSRVTADQSQRHDATRKDKGKMVANDPIIQLSASLTSDSLQISSSAVHGDCSRSEIQSFQSHKLHAQTIKDKGKTIVDATVTELSSPWISSSAAHGDCSRSEIQSFQSQKLHAQTIKDKGKTIVDATVTELSSPWISSSAAHGDCSRSEIQSFQSQKLHAQTIKDKGKTIVDATVTELSSPWISKYLHSSSSFTSDGSLSETSAAYSQELHVETRKDKGKMVFEDPNPEASEPSTPHAPLASLAASGTRERPLSIYSLRRAGQRRKNAAGNINEPVTCPPDQRIKKIGLELDYARGDNNAGARTDPLPMHKKKWSRGKNGGSMHVMPKEEVEKLRAIYADIDAFELPEEVASESELE